MDTKNWTEQDFERLERQIADGEITWQEIVRLNSLIAEGVLRRLIRRLSKGRLGDMSRIVHIWRMRRGEGPQVDAKRISHEGGSHMNLEANLQGDTPTEEEQAEQRRKAERAKEIDRRKFLFTKDGGIAKIGQKDE